MALVGSLTDGVLAGAILIPPSTPILTTNLKKVRDREKSTETSNNVLTNLYLSVAIHLKYVLLVLLLCLPKYLVYNLQNYLVMPPQTILYLEI